jgi:hypothetical protein
MRIPKLTLLVAIPSFAAVIAVLLRGDFGAAPDAGVVLACLLATLAMSVVETSIGAWRDARRDDPARATFDSGADLAARLSQLRTTVIGRRALVAQGDFPPLPAGVAFDNFHFAPAVQVSDRELAGATWNRLLSTVDELRGRAAARGTLVSPAQRSLRLTSEWRTERPRAFQEYLDALAAARARSHSAISLVMSDGLLGPQAFLPAAIMEAARRAHPLVDRAARGCLRIDASHDDPLVGLVIALAEHHEVLVRLDRVSSPSATLFMVYGRPVICASLEDHPAPLALRIAHELAHFFRKDLHHAIGSTDRDFGPSAKADRARREAGANALAIAIVARLEVLVANVEE